MTYTPSLPVRILGDTITVAEWNELVANVGYLAAEAGGKPMCRVYNAFNLTIANATLTAVTFDSERYDNSGMHSTVSNTSRITIPSAGVYAVTGNVQFANSATGTRILHAIVNGSTSTGIIAKDESPTNSATYKTSLTVHCSWSFAAGDYVELYVYQDSTGNLTLEGPPLTGSSFSPEFSVNWLSLTP